MTSTRPEGLISTELVVHGALKGKSDLRIDGVFEGELAVAGNIHIGPDGSVSAPVDATSVDVEGEVRGDVRASDAVAVRAGARLVGNVHALRVTIEDGGSLQGGIDMDFEVEGQGGSR